MRYKLLFIILLSVIIFSVAYNSSAAPIADNVHYVPHTIVERALRNALHDTLPSLSTDENETQIRLSNNNQSFAIDSSHSTSPKILALQIREKQQRFSATVRFSGESNKDYPIQGRYEKMIRIPMLHSATRNGTTINESHITWQPVAERYIRPNVITSSSLLIGNQPKRFIPAGRPISVGDIIPPYFVQKNNRVKIIYQSGLIHLETTGIAKVNGLKGETIPIINTTSNKTIYATITDYGIVEIGG